MKFFKTSGGSYFRPVLVGATIIVVLTMHFAVSQFIALENFRELSVSDLIYHKPLTTLPPSSQTALIEQTDAAVKPQIEIKSNKEQIITPFVADEKLAVDEKRSGRIKKTNEIKRNPYQIFEKDTVIKKRTPIPSRETRAERLRRAEKILTGV